MRVLKGVPLLLGTRVARRVLTLFVLSAVIPLGAVATVGGLAVGRHLEDQSREDLRQLARNTGQSILQQVLIVERALQRVRIGEPGEEQRARATIASLPALTSIGVHDRNGSRVVAERGSVAPPGMEWESLPRSGLRIAPSSDPSTFDFTLVAADADASTRIRGTVLRDSLWAPAREFATLPSVAAFCVFPGTGVPHFCARDGVDLGAAFRGRPLPATLGIEEVEEGGHAYIVGYWSFHPGGAFDRPPWTVIVAEARESVTTPLRGFGKQFASVLALGFGVVLLLANVQIRRTMEPLDELARGTKRFADGDLEARVDVASSDEFGLLSTAFNVMAEQVGGQMARLEAARAIDHAVLGGFDVEEVVDAVLRAAPCVARTASVAVVLIPERSTMPSRIAWRLGADRLGGTDVTLTARDRHWLRTHATHGMPRDGETDLLRIARRGIGPGPVTIFPFVVKGQSRGALVVESPSAGLRDAELVALRQLADQAAVAFDDARLFDQLQESSWGAIRALARAIDAKSRWTAGHSERVTAFALSLGRAMGISEEQQEILHRGGLLHDVGKIGIPAEILDRPAPLDAADFDAVRRHPEIGARILEPISAFDSVLPLVLQHHERWDGLGYPRGLAGTDIDPLARILAVADAYDAMSSARPYRDALVPEMVRREILEGAGSQFDPEVVAAFRTLEAARHPLLKSSPRPGGGYGG